MILRLDRACVKEKPAEVVDSFEFKIAPVVLPSVEVDGFVDEVIDSPSLIVVELFLLLALTSLAGALD